MSLRILYAHLGLVEPGTAATDRDGDVWCVWPDGMAGNGGPALTRDINSASSMFGPFDVLATGLTEEQCDEIADASELNNRSLAREIALRAMGKVAPEAGTLATELPIESIDGPNGLRHHARLVGGRLGPDGQPEQRLSPTVGTRVRRIKTGTCGTITATDPGVGRGPFGLWRVKFDHGLDLWHDASEFEVIE